MVVKDTDFPVSNCDTFALAKSKQQNHPEVARIEVTQPLKSKCTQPYGGSSYVAKFTDHHTRLKSVYYLSKKNEAIDALINTTPKTW